MEAHMLKTKIQNAGFECTLIDEKTVDTDPLVSQAIGGVKLRVKKSDLKDVIEVMDGIPEMVLINPKGHIVSCANCHSKQVASAVHDEDGLSGVFKGIIRSAKMLNPSYSDNIYLCLKCNEKFEF
jgi:hypothetical protein